MTRLLPAAFVACLLLAGCTGNGAQPDDASKLTGKTESRILDPDDPTSGASGGKDGGRAETAPGLGEIRGRVRDDAGLNVSGATVSVLGTDLSTVTGADGTFRFLNVTPGDHVIRVVSKYFRVHEGGITVRADRVTLAEVTLVPPDNVGAGYRPHLHDYWGTANEILLFDQSIPWPSSGAYGGYPVLGGAYQGVAAANQANAWVPFGIPERGDGLPAIVLPGTGALRITVTWDEDDVDVDGFTLRYSTPLTPMAQPVAAPFRNGVEQTVELEPGMPDNGHQVFTLWGFGIQPTARTPPNTIFGPIQVKAVMVKGEVPVEPPHPDFWGPNATYLSRRLNTTVSSAGLCCTESKATAYMDWGRLVPPGTKVLQVRFQFSSNKAPGTAHDFDWDLRLKPANLPPAAPLSDYRAVQPSATPSPGVKLYEIPLASGETDAFYQTGSNVRFQIVQAPSDMPMGVAEYDHTFRLEVVSVKDPAFQ